MVDHNILLHIVVALGGPLVPNESERAARMGFSSLGNKLIVGSAATEHGDMLGEKRKTGSDSLP